MVMLQDGYLDYEILRNIGYTYVPYATLVSRSSMAGVAWGVVGLWGGGGAFLRLFSPRMQFS